MDLSMFTPLKQNKLIKLKTSWYNFNAVTLKWPERVMVYDRSKRFFDRERSLQTWATSSRRQWVLNTFMARNVILGSFLFIHLESFNPSSCFPARNFLPRSSGGKGKQMEERERGEKMAVTGMRREKTCVASLHKSAITKPVATISKQLPFLVINSPNSWPQHQLECLEHGHFLLRWFSPRFLVLPLVWIHFLSYL